MSIMGGHRSFNELRASTPERQERVAGYEQSLRTALQLRDLRTRSGLGQRQLAARMDVSQEFASKLERGSDPRLSSITRHVNAIGGEVEIRVAMPKHKKVTLELSPKSARARLGTKQQRDLAAAGA